tara:strand:- start:32 stop:1009 length:978 start_codon:yes stop_codon:yes gene_type:complete
MNLAFRFDFARKNHLSYGHFFRIYKIYNFLKKKSKIRFIFLVKTGDKYLFSKFFKGEFIKIGQSSNYQVIEKRLQKKNIKNIICDLPYSCDFISKIKKNFKIIGIKDNLKNLNDFDLIFFPFLNSISEKKYIIKKSKENGFKYYCGLQYLINLPSKKKINKIKKKIKEITISIGGSDILNLSTKIIDVLLKIKKREFKINLICGPGFRSIIKTDNKKNIYIYRNLNNLKFENLRLKSDIFICSGGQTMYENIYSKIPSICFPTSKNEGNAINILSKNKLVKKAKIKKLPYIIKKMDLKERKKIFFKLESLNLKNLFFDKLSKVIF